MRKILMILFFIVIYIGTSFAYDVNIAHSYYDRGDFDTACNLYEEYLQEDINNPYLYYNLGNCYFKLDRKGLAIANYYKSFNIYPRSKSTRTNLNIALISTGQELVPKGLPIVLHQLYYLFSHNELKGIFFLSLWIFLLLAIICILKYKTMMRRRVYISFLIMLCFFIWYLLISFEYGKDKAVVINYEGEIKAGPSDSFSTTVIAPHGTLVYIKDEKDDWYLIKIKQENLQGWVNSKNIFRI